MSLFDFPRIHVSGTHIVNVGTGNNDSASPGEELTVTSDSQRVQPVAHGKSDDEFSSWMMSTDHHGLLRSQWNYFGDMGFRFLDVRVSTIQLSMGQTLTEPTEDALIGARVYLNHSFMCDANPEGFDSTQVFAESLQISSKQALKGGVFLSRKPTRATTRSLNWYRNVSYHGPFGLPPHGIDGELSSGGAGGASATFEHMIEIRPEDLEEPAGSGQEFGFHRLLPAASPGLHAFVAALRRRAYGLVFRYNLYLCSPLLSDTELARRFANGERLSNPAYGKLVGTIAPLYEGEERAPTMGRFLKPCAPFTNPYKPARPYFLAPAIAHVDAGVHRLSIDLCNSLPEDGEEAEKFNLGTIQVGIRKATDHGADPKLNDHAITPIGTVINSKWEYLDRGGMADIDLTLLSLEVRETIDNANYELVMTSSAGVMLAESEFMVSCQSSCNYLDDLAPGETWDDRGVRDRLNLETSIALRGEVQVFSLRRGQVPLGPTQLLVEQWRLTPTGSESEDGVYKYPTLLGQETLVLHDGVGVFRFRPIDGPGLRRFRFVPSGHWPTTITPRSLAEFAFKEFFAEVRVLPYDDYSSIGVNDLTFAVIYREVFRYYHLILPAMSLRLDMSDAAIWATPTAAQMCLRVLDPRLWDHYDYMPRTRDLSRSRRELLIRYFETVLEAHDVPVERDRPALIFNGSSSSAQGPSQPRHPRAP